MEILDCNLNDEKKNKIISIIKDSFKQKYKSKAAYVYDYLKQIYQNEGWSVFYILNTKGMSFRFHFQGNKLFCNYKKYIIWIYSNIININQSNNYLNEYGDFEKLEEEIDKYKLLIKEKDKEIENLKKELQKNKQNNSLKKSYYPRDQILALNFISSDSSLHFGLPCIKKDLFVDVEKKLYDIFPEYKEKNNNFLTQGKVVLRFKTVGENKLVSGIPIIMQVPPEN